VVKIVATLNVRPAGSNHRYNPSWSANITANITVFSMCPGVSRKIKPWVAAVLRSAAL